MSLKSNTISIRTNGDGNANLGVGTSLGTVVLVRNAGDGTAFNGALVPYTYGGEWYVKFIGAASSIVTTNVSGSITYFYI